MTPSDRCRRLSREILSRFGDGFVIDAGARRYMEACLPGMSVEALARSICETPDLDIAPLMELIFFPDEALQARLEPLLESESYDDGDEAAVVALLSAETIRTTLGDSSGKARAAFQLPAAAIPPFVRRLGISRRIPPELTETISALYPPESAVRIKVRIRNTRIVFTAATTDFLKRFFMGIGISDPAFSACLASLLSLLETQKPVSDPFRLLRAGIDTLHRTRAAAIAFEKQLRLHNMETLMQMGMRPPETGREEAERKIGLLEKIGNAVAMGGLSAGRKLSPD